MKKLIYSFIALAMTAFTLTGCEDVPMPYNMPTVAKDTTVVVPPAGTGTKEDPYNVAAALAFIKGLGADVNSSEIYVKGKVVSVTEFDVANYGNATYYISDDGTSANQLYIYRSKGLGNKKFTADDTPVQEGDEVIICGQFVYFKGSTPESAANNSYLYSHNGKVVDPNGGGGTVQPGDPQGSGTEASPYNVAAALKFITALVADQATTTPIYVKGKVSSIKEFSASFGNMTYYISDDGTENNQLYVFRGKYLKNEKFTSQDQLKVGDEVVVVGNVVNYKGNTPEFNANDNYLYSLKSNGSNEGGGEASGNEMTAATIISGKTGSVALDENKYGSQDVTKEETWYTWAFNSITYKGAKICKATAANGAGIQMQGNASTAANQGFLFNATPFASDIKTITITLKVVSTSTYAPGYSLYAGTAAHPTGNAITANSTNTTEGSFKVYTETYDLSGGSYRYFTIANDKVGAIYIDKVVVTLK